MNTFIKTVAILVIIYLFVMYSPTLLDCNPMAYSLLLPSFDGPLKENYKLNDAEILYTDDISGPESMVFQDGAMYTGLKYGRIVKIKDNKVETVAQTGRHCEMPYEEHQCGRPLGMRVGKDGLLYTADAFYGIFTMNFSTGALTHILPSSVLVDGQKMNFPDDLDLDEDGNLYLTDASKKWDLSTIFYMILEHENGGRVIRHNIHTKVTEVLISNLSFPNGIQVSKDTKSILIAEFLNRRILRYYIKGPNKGKLDVFADNLPGEPDNIRSSPRGYWVAFSSPRNSSNYMLLDTLSNYPNMRRLFGRVYSAVSTLLWSLAEMSGNSVLKTYAYFFKRGHIVFHFLSHRGLVVEYDYNGDILRSLHSPDGKVNILSEVKEHEGYLYLGSFYNNYLGRLKL